MSMTALNVESLSVEYKGQTETIRAVDNVTFSLESGESLGIVGESGCGKSTLGMALLRSLADSGTASGTIRLGGKSILDMPKADFDARYRWKQISMVFQAAMNSLDPVYTIDAQLHEVLAEHKYEGDYQGAIRRTVNAVGLDTNILDRYPHELSGGMRQRIVIAMALLLEPQLIIADEPTTALDVLVQSQIIKVLTELKKSGTSIILITHDLALLSEIADKIAIMYAGQLVEMCSAKEIYTNPQHPYTRALIAATPTLDGKFPKSIPGSPPNLAVQNTACRFMPRCAEAFSKCECDPPTFSKDSRYTRCWLYE